MSQRPRILIVGIGSPHGDDQVGWLVADELAWNLNDKKDISIRRATIPLDVLDWLEGIDVLHICDACESEPGQGSFHRLNWNAGAFTDGLPASQPMETTTASVEAMSRLRSQRARGSHDFGLSDVLRLAEATQILPKQVIVWAIEGNRFGPEEAIGDACRVAVLQAVDEMRREFCVDC